MKFITSLLALLCAHIPTLAIACTVCFDPNDEARIAFIITTGLLTFVPLIVLWLLFRWLKKRAEEYDRETELLLSREVTDP